MTTASEPAPAPTPRKFSDLGIKVELKSFVGEHIKISKLLDKQIIVHDFKTEQSNFAGERLDLQITFNGEKRVTWTSSKYLIEAIRKVPATDFPFTTNIVKTDERYEFT